MAVINCLLLVYKNYMIARAVMYGEETLFWGKSQINFPPNFIIFIILPHQMICMQIFQIICD